MQSSQLKLKNLVIISTFLLLFGAFIGYCIVQILAAIATPNFNDYFISKELYSLMFGAGQSFETQFGFGIFIADHIALFSVLFILLFFSFFYLWLKLILPETAPAWKANRPRVFFISIFILMSLTYIFNSAFFSLNNSIFEISSIDIPQSSAPALSLLFTFTAFLVLFSSVRWIEILAVTEQHSYGKIILFSLIGTGVVGLFNFYLATLSEQFFKSMFALGSAGEATMLGWERIHFSVIFISAISLAFLGSFTTCLLKPKPLQNLFIPLVLAALIVIPGQYFMHYSNNTLDMQYSTLATAANLNKLPQATAESTIIILDNVSPVNIEKISFRSENIYGVAPSGPIDLIPENNQRLIDYIQKDRFTYYTDTAMNALVEISKRHWDMERFRDANQHAIDNNGGIIYGMILLASLTDAPASEGNKTILSQLSDESKYMINGKSAYRIAKAWITFGNIDKARYFYDKAIKTMDKNDIVKWETLLTKYRYNNGRIIGNFSTAPIGSKVALISGETDRLPSFHNIKSIAVLDESKNFLFDHLPAGKYTLAVMLPDGAAVPKQVIGGGIVEISSEKPNDTIEIVFEY